MLKKIPLKKNLNQIIIKKTLNKYLFGILVIDKKKLSETKNCLIITKNALKTKQLISFFKKYKAHFPLNFYFFLNYINLINIIKQNLQNVILIKIKNKFLKNKLISKELISLSTKNFILYNFFLSI